jgi:hypothetical protein
VRFEGEGIKSVNSPVDTVTLQLGLKDLEEVLKKRELYQRSRN